jgi:hypothetical protein
MKLPDFEDVLKIGTFSGLYGFLRTTEFQFLPTFLGYLMGHRWGAPTLLT